MNCRALAFVAFVLALLPWAGCSGGGGAIGPLAPTITMQPASQTVNAGQMATFSVAASGTAPLSYQWEKNGASIGGANSSTYTTPATTAADNGAAFTVIVSNSGGNTPSNPATLTVHSGPMITSQPLNQTVNLGAAATFSVTATGTGALSYQWAKDGTAINNAIAASYTTPPTVATDNGAVFSVTVTDSTGRTPSNPATLTVSGIGGPGTDVVTFKNDLARTGQNLTETMLTPSNVASATFGLKRNLLVDGLVDAQPLYVSQLNFNGTLHNTVFVATEQDSVYAFDADSGTKLWQHSVLLAGETPGDDHGCGQVGPIDGITATPVIDRTAGAHGTIFVVAMTKDNSNNYHHRIHALDLTTGAELLGPTEVQATYPTMGGGTTAFDPGQYKERPGLLLLNSVVYTAWSSNCDSGPYTGWIIGYSESTLARSSVFNIAPNSGGGGPSIWMSGDGLGADSSGNIYLLAGNGVFEETLVNGFPSGGDYGNAFVKISTSGGALAVADYWEMFNEVSENANDADLGSGGALLLPDMKDSGGTTRHLAVGAGKDSNLYVVDRDNMGKFNTSKNNIWQELDGVLPGGIWASPAYFNNTVYYGDVGGTLKAFPIANAKLSSTPASQSSASFGYPGTSPTVSANGAAQGVVWVAENASPAVLHAYDATDLSKELYNSTQAAGGRDACGSGNKFIAVTIADGKVFMGTTNSVCVFGLLP
jgi:hypothetical protein